MRRELKLLRKAKSVQVFSSSFNDREEPFFYRQDNHKERIIATDIKDKDVLAISISVPVISPSDLAWWNKMIAKKEFIKKNSKLITLKRDGYLSLTIDGEVATIYTNNKAHLRKVLDINKDYISVKYHFVHKKRYSLTTHLENIKEIVIDE